MRSVAAAAERFLPRDGMRGIVLVDKDRHTPHLRKGLLQQFQPLACKRAAQERGACHVAARPGQTGDEPACYRIVHDGHDDRDRSDASLAARAAWLPATMMTATLRSTKSLASAIKLLLAAFRKPINEHNVSPHHITTIAQSLLERLDVVLRWRDDAQESELHG